MAYDRRQSDVVISQERGRGLYRDYRLEVRHAEVPVGVPRTFKVLDPQRAATLRGWVECLVPARRGRPSAAEVGAAEYIDATVDIAGGLFPHTGPLLATGTIGGRHVAVLVPTALSAEQSLDWPLHPERWPSG